LHRLTLEAWKFNKSNRPLNWRQLGVLQMDRRPRCGTEGLTALSGQGDRAVCVRVRPHLQDTTTHMRRIDQTPCLTSGRKRGWAGLTATRRELAVDGTRGRASVATSRRCSLPEMKICAGVVLAPPLHDSGSTTVRVYSMESENPDCLSLSVELDEDGMSAG
jgi:hypothetical protein